MARRKEKKQDNQESVNPSDTNAFSRVVLALQLRRIGHTYEEIAQRCGYASPSGAYKAIKAAEAKIIHDEARALVALQLSQIQFALTNAVMPKIEKGDLWAVDRLVPLLKRQAELLGLDAKETPLVAQVLIRQYAADTEAV